MINRMNYEEYLLMYVDGELSPADKQAAESFLQNNPDLKEELQVLQQAVLQPEELNFTGKHILYKKESGITLTNYEEYFLLYVDNELSKAERGDVEMFVLQHPQLQGEFTLLKQTVLETEVLSFGNKEVLYRKEEKRRPVVISLRWASLAAAVMIGLIAFIWMYKGGNEQQGVAGNTPNTGVTPKNTTPTTTEQPQQQLQQENIETTSINPNTVAVTGQDKKLNTTVPVKEKVQQTITHQPQQLAVVPEERKENTTVAVIETNPVITQPTIVKPNTTSTNSTDNSSNYTNVSNTDVAANNYVKPAVNTTTEELDTNEEDKNLLVGSMQINPDKVRTFFRKAGRFFSSKVKKNNNDEDANTGNLVNKLK
jgi:hypothetical protein